MAKPRSKRRHGKASQGSNGRVNPASRQSEVSSDKIAGIKEKLESKDASERIIGLTSLNALASDDETYSVRSIFTEGLDASIWKLTKDPVAEVRAESLGFLRNMYGGSNGILIKQDQILDTINENIASFGKYFDPENELPIPVEKKEAIVECCESILAIVSSIGVQSEEPPSLILQRVPQFPLFLRGILEFAVSEKSYMSSSLVELAMEAVLTYSEDFNERLSAQLSLFDFEKLSQSSNNAVKAYLYSYAFSSSQQASSSSSSSMSETCLVSLTNLIASIDIDEALSNLVPNVSDTMSLIEQGKLLKKSNTARSNVLAVEIALEAFTSIFESLQQTASSNFKSAGEYLSKDTLIQIEKTLAYDTFMARSLAALNNLIWTVDTYFGLDNAQWSQSVKRLWGNLTPKISFFLNRDAELQSLLGCLWGLAKTAEGQLPVEPVISTPNGSVLDIVTFTTTVLFEDYRQSPENPPYEKRHAMANAIHFLAQLARAPGRIVVTSKITDFLVSIIMSNDISRIHPVIMAEALSDFFDIFGDKAYFYDEQLFVKAGLLSKLRDRLESLNRISAKIPDSEDREVFDEELENLYRFLEYKEQE